MRTDTEVDKFLIRVEQIVKSEVKLLLTSQRSIEGRQAELERLLKQWMDAGSHGRFNGESEQRIANIEEVTESVQPARAGALDERTSCVKYSLVAQPSDAQVATPGQDQEQQSGRSSPSFFEPIVHSQTIEHAGSDEPRQTLSSASEFLRKTINGIIHRSTDIPTVRRSVLGQQLRAKSRGDTAPRLLDRIVFSWVFDVVFGALIVLNSVSIGAEIEYKTIHARTSTFFTIIATTFAVLFLVELLLRIAANGLMIYFFGPENLWNIFDVVMVIVSMIEVLDTLASAQGRSSPFRLLRMVRLLRIARVLRFAPQLRMILIMMFESIKSLVWLLCVLVAILYVFSIIFTMGAIDYLGVPGNPSFTRKRYSAEISTHYGTVVRSLYTLFKAITSGQSWGETMDPLTDVGSFYVVVFLIYIAFAVLALLNIVAGEFVERALTKSQCDRDCLVEKQMRGKQACMKHLKIMFEEGDRDRSGNITFQEFETHMQNERFIAYLSHLAIDTDNINDLFEQLDRDGNGSISLQEFVDNLLHLARGQTVEQVVQRIVNGNLDLKYIILKMKDFVEVEIMNIKLKLEQLTDVPAVANNVQKLTTI